jgi:hypothetical protein
MAITPDVVVLVEIGRKMHADNVVMVVKFPVAV